MSHEEKFNNYRIKLINKFYGHIKAAVYLYAHLKFFFGKSTENVFLLKVLTGILSPILFMLIWTLKFARSIIEFKIRQDEGNNFVRLLNGTESIFLAQEKDTMRALITTLFLVEYNGHIDELQEICQREILQIFSNERFLKLRCTVESKFGYYYFKRSKLPMHKHFLELQPSNNNSDEKNLMTMEQLRVVISDLSNAEMPNNNKALWEFRIGRHKLETTGKIIYPLVFRFHHITGDAAALFNMFSCEFQHHSIQDVKMQPVQIIRDLNNCYDDPFITMSGLRTPPDNNILCRTNGNKHVVWHTETEPEILNQVKQIKEQLDKNVTVVDIILTCFAESVDDILRKKSAEYPENIWTIIPMMPRHLHTGEYGSYNYTLSNQISLGLLRIPLKMSPGCNLLRRLDLINHEYDVFKNKSLDFECNRWQGTVILTLLPQFILKWLVGKYCASFMISNIAGCSSLRFFDKFKVSDFIVVDPNIGGSGISLMVTSYEKRLSFAYTIDKAVISDIEDVRSISGNFLRNLNKLQQLSSRD